MRNNPETSIVLSILNGEKTLSRCLQSISEQTYRNFELIIVNDGSTDKTAALLTRWQIHFGKQMLVSTHSESKGLTVALNTGIKRARSAYIARIDADDWWHSDKLKIQTDYMNAHLEVGVVGTWYTNNESDQRYTIRLPVKNEDVKKSIYRHNPFGHSTVLIRRELLTKVGGYDHQLQYGQDRDLWFRLAEQTQFANIPKILCYRDISSSSTNKRKQIIQNLKTTSKYIRRHHASPIQYIHLIEPLTVLLAPQEVRQKIRKLRSK